MQNSDDAVGLSAGTYFVTVTDSNGCMATTCGALTVYTLPSPVLSWNGTTIDAGPGYSSYQWQWNGASLGGAVNQTHDPLSFGDFNCIVVDSNGCTGYSDTLYANVGVNETMLEGAVQLYPNPTSGLLNLTVDLPNATALQVEITDIAGKTVQSLQFNGASIAEQLDLSALEAGIYTITISTPSESRSLRIIRK